MVLTMTSLGERLACLMFKIKKMDEEKKLKVICQRALILNVNRMSDT